MLLAAPRENYRLDQAIATLAAGPPPLHAAWADSLQRCKLRGTSRPAAAGLDVPLSLHLCNESAQAACKGGGWRDRRRTSCGSGTTTVCRIRTARSRRSCVQYEASPPRQPAPIGGAGELSEAEKSRCSTAPLLPHHS